VGRLGLGSLRARLLVGLVVLAAIGLVVAGYVTYSEERSFLLGQVNADVITSFNSVEDQVDGLNHLRGPAAPSRRPGHDSGNGRPPPGPERDYQIDPRGTFGEHIGPRGGRVGKPVAYGFTGQNEPQLPRDLRPYLSTQGHTRLFTVRANGDPNLSYRLMARAADIGSGVTVVGLSLAGTDALLSRLKAIEAIVIGSVLAALALLAWGVVRIGLRPLDRIGATAGAIAAGDLARRVSPAEGRTEVGRLGLALNTMLGPIEHAVARQRQSEERLRRFLSDASHELRTPLTSIRGYAELLRRGATATTAERDKAAEQIEHEASRMGIVVEQLLALARLDELPTEPHEPGDPLARDAGDE
jgi:two-component system OmpR family sensor kinase